MARTTIVLFIIGLMLEVSAFLGSHAENLPFVLTIVSPSYIRAMDGLSEMERTMVLEPNQRGFDELSSIFLNQLTAWNPEKDVLGVSVKKITRKAPALTFSRLRAKEKVPLIFTISNGQNLKWDLEALMKRVDTLRSTRLFLMSVVVFILGVVIQILAFIMEILVRRKTGQPSEYGVTS